MDDERVQHRRRVDRHALVAVQQHADDKADDEQEQVIDGLLCAYRSALSGQPHHHTTFRINVRHARCTRFKYNSQCVILLAT
jgi:hypothetical protein